LLEGYWQFVPLDEKMLSPNKVKGNGPSANSNRFQTRAPR
jgi:hypothetical protein